MASSITVPHKVLASMQTSLGKSVLELSNTHRVSLTFTKWFGCPICKYAVEELSQYLPTFLKMNVVPVICHQESDEEGRIWLYNAFSKHPYAKYIPYVGGVDAKIHQAFGLQRLSMMKHVRASPKLVQHISQGYKLTIPKVENPFVQFGLFLVEKGNVVKSWEFEALGSRPNYGEYLLTFDQPSLEHVQSISALFPKVNSGVPNLTKQVKNRNSWGIEDVLASDDLRAKFKIFVINEYSIENLLFVENVEVYKAMKSDKERTKLSEKILSTFLKDSSFMEINVNKEIKDKVANALADKGPVHDLFDSVVNELKFTVLNDSIVRFKQSKHVRK